MGQTVSARRIAVNNHFGLSFRIIRTHVGLCIWMTAQGVLFIQTVIPMDHCTRSIGGHTIYGVVMHRFFPTLLLLAAVTIPSPERAETAKRVPGSRPAALPSQNAPARAEVSPRVERAL